MIWIAAALLLFAVLAAVLAPLLRRPDETASESHDLHVYKDQLAEIDKDLERGLLTAEDAELARREIARRLIRADRDATGPLAARSWARPAAVLLLLAIPLVGVAAYVAIGAPHYPDQPLSARGPDGDGMTIEAMLEQVEARLAEAPEDGMGWAVVAPVYLGMQRFSDSANAYRKAIDLVGPTPERWASLGEAIVLERGGTVTPQARSAFERALALDPAADKPRVFLAIGARQRGDRDEAIQRWQALLADADGDEPWMALARNEMAVLGAPMPPVGLAAPGPAPAPGGGGTEAPVAGPAGADQVATAEMIEGMVSRLATRLRSQGGSAEEWAQLATSYMVLGRPDAARSAIDDGLAALSGDPAAVAALEEAARQLDL